MKSHFLKNLLTVFVVLLSALPSLARAELTVMISGAFALAYQEMLPEFERSTGVKVVTLSGASQGTGPSTIKAQLARGVQVDMVIMSKEGLDELVAVGRIASGTPVVLSTSPLGAAVRAGSPKPDVSSVAAFKDSLLKARLISMPGSTSGMFIRDKVLPGLGIADQVSLKVVARGAESTKMLAAGESDLALGPVSELVNLPGVDFVAELPRDVQLIQEIATAVVQGSPHMDEARALISLLSSAQSAPAIRRAGMTPLTRFNFANTPPATPEVLKELAPTGKLRAAINFGNPVLAQREASTGEPVGISVDLSRELARRLGVPVELVLFEAAGKVADAAKAGVWDVAFLAIDPGRAGDIAFTAPYVEIEGTYLVSTNSPLKTIHDVDKDGVRMAVGKGSVYDLYLTRTIQKAELVRAPTSPKVIDVYREQKLDVAAGVRQQLVAFAAGHPEVRVMEGRFMLIEQAMGTPQGRPQALAYLRRFVEDAKASGFAADALVRSNQKDATVAPLAK